MNRLIFIGIGIIVLSLFSVIIFMSRSADDKSSDTEVFDTSSFDMSSLKIPKTPKNWSQAEFDKKWAEEMTKADVLLEDIPIDMDEILSTYNRTDADLVEIRSMLSKFKSLDSMSESSIIDTLMSFYPAKERTDGLRELTTDYYRKLDEIYEGRLTKEQKLEIIVYDAHQFISELREADIEVAETIRISEELRKSDPDLYYATELADLASEIAETEDMVRSAEKRGDTVWAESMRNHLSVLHEFVEDVKWTRDLESNIEASAQEALKNWLEKGELPPGMSDEDKDEIYRTRAELDRLRTGLDELRLKIDNMSSEDIEGSVSTPEDIKGSGSSSEDVKDTESIPVQDSISFDSVSNFSPVFSDIDRKYSDVISSMSLSERDLSKLSVSSRELLRSRTSEMQRTVVSELRKAMVSMKNVSETKKRELVYDFVMKSYNKEFATSVLRQLDTDTK